MSLEQDHELLSNFLSEVRDTFGEIEADFIALEANPDDVEIVNRIFRPVHSIKGNAPFFGLKNLSQVSHRLENLLDGVRKGNLRATPQIIETMIEGVDLLKGIVEGFIADDRRVEVEPAHAAYIEKIEGIVAQRKISPVDALRTMLERIGRLERMADAVRGAAPEGVAEVLGEIAKLNRESRELAGQTPAPDEPPADLNVANGEGKSLATAFAKFDRAFAAIENGDTGRETVRRAHAAMGVLAEALHVVRAPAAVAELGDEIDDDLATVENFGPGFLPELVEIVSEKVAGFRDVIKPLLTAVALAEEKAVGENGTARTEKPAEQAPKNDAIRKTMRIDETAIDDFLGFVGELITTGNSLNLLELRLRSKNGDSREIRDFKNINQAFRELSDKLQNSLLEIRRVSVKSIFNKMPRIVRDLAQKTGKEIDFTLRGEDTRLDKSLVEKLEDPLVHMIRNAVDHGIEPPDERAKAGKPRRGRIELAAWTRGETFYASIIDDGRGLDPEKLKKAAVEKGVLTEARAATMSESEAFDLIFQAGFSTAREVSDVSGRGVGMDVVNDNIRRSGGDVEIASTIGKGSSFVVRLPLALTLMVTNGLEVAVNGKSFIVPIKNIVETIKPAPQDCYTAAGRGEMVNIRGSVMRMIRLGELVGEPHAHANPWEALVVVMQHEGKQCAVFVDELLGQLSVVQKEKGEKLKDLTLVEGWAIMGNGDVGLILDAAGLIRSAGLDRAFASSRNC